MGASLANSAAYSSPFPSAMAIMALTTIIGGGPLRTSVTGAAGACLHDNAPAQPSGTCRPAGRARAGQRLGALVKLRRAEAGRPAGEIRLRSAPAERVD